MYRRAFFIPFKCTPASILIGYRRLLSIVTNISELLPYLQTEYCFQASYHFISIPLISINFIFFNLKDIFEFRTIK